MSFINKVKIAGYELLSPEKNELLNDIEELKQNTNFGDFDNIINEINIKIVKSTNGKQRYFLEKQIKELEKMNEIYVQSKNINITKYTKKEIKNLIIGLEKQISLKNNNIGDDTEKLNTILYNEKTRLNDNFDLFGIKNIRDRVESSVNIIGIKESIPLKKHQDFFDILTVEYINFIEKKLNKKLEQENENEIFKNNGLFLNKYEINEFLKYFLEKNSDYNFDLEIKLEKNGTKENFKINLEEYKIIIEKEKKEMKKQEEAIEEKIRIKEMKKIFENNIEKFTVKERMFHINNILNEDGFNIYYDEVLNYLEGTTIYLKDKQIKLTKEFIEDNKEKLIKNIKTLTSLIIEIESDGNHKAKNPFSTATGLGQWLIDDGKKSKEYMYNKKWYSSKIKGKTPSKVRNIRLTSSFETDLKSIKKEFENSFFLKELSFINNLNFNSRIELSPDHLELKEQIKLLILRFIINNKGTKNGAGYKVSKKDYLSTAIIGNIWGIKELYKKFHHTDVDKETSKRIKKIVKKYNFEKID